MSREEEIKLEIDQINQIMKKLADNSNDLWVQKDRLRNEFKKITGNEY